MGYRVKQLVVHELIANEMRSDAYGHVHAFFIDFSFGSFIIKRGEHMEAPVLGEPSSFSFVALVSGEIVRKIVLFY